jgi:hypothetical protein
MREPLCTFWHLLFTSIQSKTLDSKFWAISRAKPPPQVGRRPVRKKGGGGCCFVHVVINHVERHKVPTMINPRWTI